MRIVFIGDIMGRSGREALEKHLPRIKDELNPDLIIVNGENAANGAGITEKIATHFFQLGVDCITTGNHVWDQREALAYITREKHLLRPINFPPGTPGLGHVEIQTAGGHKVLVVNAMARLFMDALDDPFRAMDGLLKDYRLGQNVNAIFVDFHGETTSEKMSMGHHLDGRVSAVIGTHTHIPTADYHIMENGTAFQSDAGMSGDYNSVIGVEKAIAMHRFVKKTPSERMRPAGGEGCVCGNLIEINENSGKATNIEPIRIGAVLAQTFPKIN